MSHANISHRRTHNLLLISKLLNQRENASPFTLVLDTLEQPAGPLVREYLRRTRFSKTSTIFLSYETFVKPKNVDFYIECHRAGTGPEKIAREVMEVMGRHGGKRMAHVGE